MRPQQLYKSIYMNNNYTQSWPYLQANYNDWQSIVTNFPHLAHTNPEEYTPNPNSQAIVIRSGNDDNVHKAIKYGIWTTTPKNKNKIQQLWQRKVNHNTDTYLFFSAVKSGMFEGVAVLRSGFHEETFPFWWENHTLKFKGYFQIEWIYIKDINNKHFSGLFNMEGQEVSKSKDCDTLDSQTTNAMLQVFAGRKMKRNIFMDFAFMDERERQYIRKMYEMTTYYNQYNMMGYNNYQNGYNNGYSNNNYNGNQNFSNNYNNGQRYDISQLNLNGNQPLSMPGQPTPVIPQQVMRPTNQIPGSNLGFQMNPVSKNNKKK